MNLNAPPPPPVLYPDSDGQPMADNTRQLRWITTLCGNLSALFGERPDVFVAADLLWYPVEGQPAQARSRRLRRPTSSRQTNGSP